MSEVCRGILIISNHFKEQPVEPKIVYANKYFLNLIDCNLDKVVNQDPSKIFANWDKDGFIQEIVACVEQKISWIGNLDVFTSGSKCEKKKFIITPVYNIAGEISYYSCTTEVNKKSKKSADDNLICLDDFISSLWDYQSHFKEVYEMAPANLLKIDLKGEINFINKHAQEQFALQPGNNMFSLITEDSSKVKKFFKDKKIIGKVSKIDFDLTSKNQIWSITCRFWPIVDELGVVTGYSVSLSDITKQRDITQKLMALKEA